MGSALLRLGDLLGAVGGKDDARKDHARGEDGEDSEELIEVREQGRVGGAVGDCRPGDGAGACEGDEPADCSHDCEATLGEDEGALRLLLPGATSGADADGADDGRGVNHGGSVHVEDSTGLEQNLSRVLGNALVSKL